MKRPVLIIDDHPLFRAGVVAVLNDDPEWEVCGQARNPAEALALATQTRPDAAVVDLMLQDDDGLKLIRDLRREVPGLRIVVLSMLDEAVYKPKALHAGASAFVSKHAGPAAVLDALREATPRASRTMPGSHELAVLSERELHVFIQLGHGRSTQEIATALGVSGKTIETHRENIKGKLGLPHANALVARAALWVREQGLAR
ncbi:MAG TPA: response regulator transcription factor [Acidobacteriota bacterium]|nr:response regulator transcription factor [Acidobacteriota bacterium]